MEEIGCRRSKRIKKDCQGIGYTPILEEQAGSAMPSCPFQLEPSLRNLILNPKSKKITRPPNAFMLFARDHRKPLASKYPEHNNKYISSMLGECWRNMDSNLRLEYFQKAKMLEQLHKQQYPDYFYSPRIARLRKLEKKKKYTDKTTVNGECPLEPIPQEKSLNDMDVSNTEWNDDHFETESPTLEYIPNNPDFFNEGGLVSSHGTSEGEREFMQPPDNQLRSSSPLPTSFRVPHFPMPSQHCSRFDDHVQKRQQERPLEDRFRGSRAQCFSRRSCECPACNKRASLRHSPPRWNHSQNFKIEDDEEHSYRERSIFQHLPDSTPSPSYKRFPPSTRCRNTPYPQDLYSPYRGCSSYFNMPPPEYTPLKREPSYYDEHPTWHQNMYRNYNHSSFSHRSPSVTSLCDLDHWGSRTEKIQDTCYCDVCVRESDFQSWSAHYSHGRNSMLGNFYSNESFAGDTPRGNNVLNNLSYEPTNFRAPAPEVMKSRNEVPSFKMDPKSNYKYTSIRAESTGNGFSLSNLEAYHNISREIQYDNEPCPQRTETGKQEYWQPKGGSPLFAREPLIGASDPTNSQSVINSGELNADDANNQYAMSHAVPLISSKAPNADLQESDNFPERPCVPDSNDATLRESTTVSFHSLDNNCHYTYCTADSFTQQVEASNLQVRNGDVVEVAETWEVKIAGNI